MQGFWYFAEKNTKFRGIFRGKFAKKSADFVGFSRRKVNIRRKIDQFHGILVEKSQISKDFWGKFLEKSADFTGNFWGKLLSETISKKQPISLDFFGQISLKSINFALIWPALFNVFLTGIIICSFNNSSLEKWANAKACLLYTSDAADE